MAQAQLRPYPGSGDRPAPYPGGGGHGGGHGGHGGGHDGGHGYPYPSNPYPSNPYPSDPYPGNPGYGTEIKRIYINRNVTNERLHLRALGNIGGQYRGWEVVAVRANTRAIYSGRTIANLISDGRIVATQYDANYSIYLVPQYRLVLDEPARTMQLEINGGVYVDNIEVELRKGGYNPPPPPPPVGQNIEINVYRSVYGSDRVDLTHFIDTYRYRGHRIEQVIITANARYGTGIIGLLMNGYSVGQGQFSGGYSQMVTYRPYNNSIIGQGAENIVLNTQGDMTIEHVTLVLR